MAFQQSVGYQFTRGWPGEVINDGPNRTKPFRLPYASGQTAPNRISRAFSYTADYIANTNGTQGGMQAASAGGAGPVAGILVRPKEYALTGDSNGNPLGASYDLPANAFGELLEMGIINAQVSNPSVATATFNYDDEVWMAVGSGSPGTGYITPTLADAGRLFVFPAGTTQTAAGAAFLKIPNAYVRNAVAGVAAGTPGASEFTNGVTTVIQLTN